MSHNVAFLGCGIVAEMHGRAIAACRGAILAGAWDPERSHAEHLTAKFGGRVYESEEQLLADPKIDAVYVLSPTACHVPQAKAALAAGKHVLVEKPVAATSEAIVELRLLAEARQLVCMPAHNYVYVSSLRRGKRLIAEGKLGQLASVWVLYNIFHSEPIAARYGGVLRAVCVHHVYSLLYLAGRPRTIVATQSKLHYEKLDCEDQVMLTCRLSGTAIANLWCSFAADDPTNHPWSVAYKVLGTKGAFSYDWNEAKFEDTGGPAWGLPCYEDGFVAETEHFLHACIERGEAPVSTLGDAYDALKIILAAEKSLKSGRTETIEY